MERRRDLDSTAQPRDAVRNRPWNSKKSPTTTRPSKLGYSPRGGGVDLSPDWEMGGGAANRNATRLDEGRTWADGETRLRLVRGRISEYLGFGV